MNFTVDKLGNISFPPETAKVFNNDVHNIVNYCRFLSQRCGHAYIGTGHLLLALGGTDIALPNARELLVPHNFNEMETLDLVLHANVARNVEEQAEKIPGLKIFPKLLMQR